MVRPMANKKGKSKKATPAKKATKPSASKKAKAPAKKPTSTALVHKPKASPLKGEVVPREGDVAHLTKTAEEHDQKLVVAVKSMKDSIVDVGRELAFMQDDSLKLWKYIRNPETDGSHRGAFASWRDYAKYRLGNMGKSAMYELIAAHSLTKGPQAIPAADVQKLGVKKAAQIARLPASKRTKEVVEHAKKSKLSKVKKSVQAKIDEDKPASERKVRLFPLTRNLQAETIEMIEEIEKGGCYMEGIRDGDRTMSLRSKLWHAVWVNFRANFSVELAEGEAYREKLIEAGKLPKEDQSEEIVDSAKNSTEEDGGFPSEEEVRAHSASAEGD